MKTSIKGFKSTYLSRFSQYRYETVSLCGHFIYFIYPYFSYEYE